MAQLRRRARVGCLQRAQPGASGAGVCGQGLGAQIRMGVGRNKFVRAHVCDAIDPGTGLVFEAQQLTDNDGHHYGDQHTEPGHQGNTLEHQHQGQRKHSHGQGG